MTKHIKLTNYNITTPKSRNLLTIFTRRLPGIIKSCKSKCVDLIIGGLWVVLFTPVCTQVLQPSAVPDVGGNKGTSLGLAHSSISEVDHDICAEEFMAMTVRCSSPEKD